ncbi:2-oxo acid dehydrogenase subunit E2 [Amylibacter sp.]|nr:2-oxo acid dehydrogenase subunit E2 [Amylibacter sp.]MDC3304380.1 2-oxo acid dehydrogenase subunit E2 [Amylibacter sp.]
MDVNVPKLGVSDDLVQIVEVHTNNDDWVVKGQNLLEIETSKTTVSIESPSDGFVSELPSIGVDLNVGDLLCKIKPTKGSIDFIKKSDDDNDIDTAQYSENKKIDKAVLSDAAVSLKIELTELQKKNFKGFITKNMLLDLVKTTKDVLPHGSSHGPSIKDKQPGTFGPMHLSKEQAEKSISRRKNAEIRNLEIGNIHSLNSTLCVSLGKLEERLSSVPPLFEGNISDLVIYEGTRLLWKFQNLNSFYSNGKIIHNRNVNFGYSLDNGIKGLKVLTLNNAPETSLIAVQNEILNLINLYNGEDKILTEVLLGSTITITDLSAFPIENFIPLINGHQSAIIGINKNLKSEYLISCTFDHRVSSGLEVAIFLDSLVKRVKDYFKK